MGWGTRSPGQKTNAVSWGCEGLEDWATCKVDFTKKNPKYLK